MVDKEAILGNRKRLVEAVRKTKNDTRIRKVITEYYNADYIPEAERIMEKLCTGIITNESGDFLAFSEEKTGAVGYNKTPISITHIVDTKDEINIGRIRTKLGKYIRNRLGINDTALSDHILQKFCNIVTATEFSDIELFQIVTGKEITEAYNEGFGSSSCMCGDKSKLSKIYAINPERIALLKYYGEPQARALLWTADDGRRFLDRIYPDYGIHTEVIENWASSNGYLSRAMTDWAEVKKLKITIDALSDDEYYPYFDTFCYASHAEGNIEDHSYKIVMSANDGDYHLQNADGCTLEGDNNSYYCENCGDRIPEDEAYIVNDSQYCEGCYNRYYFGCYNCGESYNREDAIITEDGYTYCLTCAEDCVTTCEECEKTHRNTRNSFVYTEYRTVCQDCACCGECGESCTKEEIEKGSTLCNFVIICDKCRGANEETGIEKPTHIENPNQVKLNIPNALINTENQEYRARAENEFNRLRELLKQEIKTNSEELPF